ncbi:MAG: RluA family pseudouridine synthase [Lachnospiraceae bacterium]|nr:RluA family pseudouridine synthase [Lachnospiraceae bacterium]
MKQFSIQENEAGQRFDKYLKKLLKNASSGFLYKMLRKKNITLNEKKAEGSEILKTGDTVHLFLADETFDKFSGVTPSDDAYTVYTKEDLVTNKLHIQYEDDHILVLNKPAGMLSQKAGREDISVNEYLIGYLLFKKELTPEMLQTFKPAAVNRLDRNTSGLILCGKTLPGLQYLSDIIKNRTLEKYYRCIAEGSIPEKALLEGYLSKDTVKNQVSVVREQQEDASFVKTEIDPISQYKYGHETYTELSVHLITGKPHQIRAHLSSIGHPILGDKKYGGSMNVMGKDQPGNRLLAVKRQLLHAYQVSFPETQGTFSYLSGKTITAEPPYDYKHILKELQNGNME